MKMKTSAAVALLALSAVGEIVIENDAFRLRVSDDARAESFVVKATGEEMLAPGVRMPIAAFTQERPYDNEFKLMLPAKPWRHLANRARRVGDELLIEFEDEFCVAHVRLDVRPQYVAFRLAEIGYRYEDFGDKRQTEIDSIEFLRLPLKRRERFGRSLNCTWDGRGAAALLAANVETYADAFEREDGNLTFAAAGDARIGIAADGKFGGVACALVAGESGKLLDAIDRVERDFGLPLGVESRRRKDYAASYAFFHGGVTPANVDSCIALAKQMGFRSIMTCVGGIASSHGAYPYRKSFPRGDADLADVGRKVREAGLKFGLHVYHSKASTNDPTVVAAHDPRFATVCELFLARDVAADETTLAVEGNPRTLRRERGRRLLFVDGEFIEFGGVEDGGARGTFSLVDCRRGIFGTAAKSHAKLTCARHLDVDDWPYWIRYAQDGAIQNEAAERLAKFWRLGGFSFAYFDGSEDVPAPFWHYVPRAQQTVFAKFAPAPDYCETALKSHFGWHMTTRGNAFDVFAPERLRGAMKKYVLRTARQDADDFTSVNFGWLTMRPPERTVKKLRADNSQFRRADVNVGIGMQPDAFEYAASKALAWNAPLAVQLKDDSAKHPHFADVAFALKSWEDAKLGFKFSAAERETLKDPDREFFMWPFVDAARPEFVEWRQLTADAERPLRAFSYERGGKSGIVVWDIFEPTPPEFALPNATRRTVRGMVFLESSEPRADLERRALAAVARVNGGS